ncbi:MAG: helix-turn-helix transcriptional regulator [Vicingaceae bacterium]
MIDKKLLQVKIGERVKFCREEVGIHQTELASKVGLEKSNLARLESGRTNPTFLTLYKISQALDISLSKLVNIGD